jgi:NAD(P)-dependent dehydrogenase (short-subunit alcohol dehydrogenase family)
MVWDLNTRLVLVHGGARGIGRACVGQLALRAALLEVQP